MYSDLELLHHISEEIDFVLSNTGNKKKDEVLNDAILCRAIVRSLEVIGEAAKKVGNDFKLKYPNIEWRKLSGTRNKLIHDYFGIDYDIIWNIIESKLPDLQKDIDNILRSK